MLSTCEVPGCQWLGSSSGSPQQDPQCTAIPNERPVPGVSLSTRASLPLPYKSQTPNLDASRLSSSDSEFAGEPILEHAEFPQCWTFRQKSNNSREQCRVPGRLHLCRLFSHPLSVRKRHALPSAASSTCGAIEVAERSSRYVRPGKAISARCCFGPPGSVKWDIPGFGS
jgi:hypothetical protein